MYDDDVTTCPNDGKELLEEQVFLALDRPLGEGDMVGEYRILGLLGEGGFGTVYRAEHPVIGKPAAVKIMGRQFAGSGEMASRFVAEARAVNRIRHKNLIDIFSFGVLADGRPYYVMELLQGATLEELLNSRGRLSVSEALPLLGRVARALDAAHVNGIIHRDLKPDNVFVEIDDDGALNPKLLDFGIAKLLEADAATPQSHRTRTGAPIGTPAYMSPEQCRGTGVDPRTDVYSLGVMAHQLLTGRLPFEAESVMDIMVAHTSQQPPALSQHAPELGTELDAPVHHMLEKEPGKRPETAGEAYVELATAAQRAGYDISVPDLSVQSSLREALSISGGFESAPTQQLGQSMATNPTVLTAPTESKPTPVLRWLLPAGLALGLLGIGLVFLRPRAEPVKPADVASTSVPVNDAAESTVAEPSSAPPVSVATAPEPPSEVALTISAVPPEVLVYQGKKKLGVAPGPIQLPRGHEAVNLTFKARGYLTKKKRITPSENQTIRVRLQRTPKSQRDLTF